VKCGHEGISAFVVTRGNPAEVFQAAERNHRFKKATLTPERLQRLDEIDFVWNARKLESN
jgi:hypothetical protein